MDWNTLLSTARLGTTGADDSRSVFERDYDRIIYSTPFRRLQDKTQVFPLEPNDSVRTRLTHSLEVSTIARSLARNVSRALAEAGELSAAQARDIETISATCGLMHDLGNPPFGHAGERAIRDWCRLALTRDASLAELSGRAADDFIHFEGNAQTLRLVSRLQMLLGNVGLNLCAATLASGCKYTAASDGLDASKKELSKVGAFLSESRLVDEIRRLTGTNAARHPLAYLVEGADDLAYPVADLEDGVSKGLLTWDDILAELTAVDDPEVRQAAERTRRWSARAEDGVSRRELDVSLARAFRTIVIGQGVDALSRTFLDRRQEILAGTYHSSLADDSTCAALLGVCRKLGWERVYFVAANVKLELLGRSTIHRLMDLFWEGIRELQPGGKLPGGYPGKIVGLISQNYLRAWHMACRDAEVPPAYARLQLLTDWVSGMTDGFARQLLQEVAGDH